MPSVYTSRLLANRPRVKSRFDYGRLNKIDQTLNSVPALQSSTRNSVQQSRISPITPSRVIGANTQRQAQGAQQVSNARGRFQEANQFGDDLTNLKYAAIEKRKQLQAPRLVSQQQVGMRGGAVGGGDISGVNLPGLSAEQAANARVIWNVGRRMGASARDIQIALMTAFQESGIRNLNYGDRDSLGIFQQRPSQGWGSRAQVTNPEYAAQKFFSGLLGVSGREQMALTQAAQRVQRSAFPNAYAKWEGQANNIVQAFLSAGASPQQISTAAQQIGGARGQLVQQALSYIGTPYAWGGGGAGRRTSRGTGLGTQNVIGVDCSGLTSYVYSTIGINLPRHSRTQLTQGYRTSVNNLKPGDLVGWNVRGGVKGHVAIYIGNGMIVEAPRPGVAVRQRRLGANEGAFGVTLRI